MSVRRRFAFALGAGALAMVSAVANAEPVSPVIWYRSSEGCPDGAAFITRLRGAASSARLAEVTDRIDFVVTLGKNGRGSSGRLERQTATSTVAIREIEAESCEHVADVLALTLSLALDPAAAPPAGTSAEPAPVPVVSLAAPSPTTAEPAVPPSRSKVAPVDDEGRAKPEPSSGASEPVWLLGGEAGPLTGPTGALGAWTGLFVELRPAFSVLPRASTRLTALYSRSADEDTRITFITAAGRLEGCPTALGGTDLEVRPCLGLELGLATGQRVTASGRADTGTWFAANGFGRFSWRPSPTVVLSFDAGAYAPLIRYTLESESGENSHQADPIGVFAALGIALVLQ